jgi:hypothetical protein
MRARTGAHPLRAAEGLADVQRQRARREGVAAATRAGVELGRGRTGAFVDGITTGAEDRAIVDAVVRLASGLGLTALAQGVETGEQARELLDLGCALSQGYHFARPQRPADFERTLEIDRVGELVV